MTFSLRWIYGDMCGYWAIGTMFILLLVLELYPYNNYKRTSSADNKLEDWFERWITKQENKQKTGIVFIQPADNECLCVWSTDLRTEHGTVKRDLVNF